MENKTVGMQEKIAIITGGSRGLGRNTAVNLARRGVAVIFTYHSNQTEAENLIREIEAIGKRAAGFRLDTGDIRSFDGFVAEVRKTLHSWGRDRFDYLVSNAGNSLHPDLEGSPFFSYLFFFSIPVLLNPVTPSMPVLPAFASSAP